MLRHILPIALLAPMVTACSGDLGPSPVPEPEPEPEPVLEPQTVPAAPEVVSGTGFCVDLQAGESFLSVSPEGYAWLARPDADTQIVRVVDPFDETATTEDALLLDTVQQLRAFSDVDASLITEQGLWRLEEMARIQVTPPVDVAEAELCGDPGTNGQLLVGGALYERRDDTWLVWESGTDEGFRPTGLLDLDGECQSTQNVTWMLGEDGALWKLEPNTVFQPQTFTDPVGAAASNEMVAVLEANTLFTGPGEWQPWLFGGAVPTTLDASGGMLWLGAAAQLLRFDGETFVEVSHDLGGAIQQIAAHDGGAWVVSEDKACHVATGPMLRVSGVRAYSRSKELNYPFLVTTSDVDGSITASIDGEAIELTLDTETGWMAGTARVDQVGWSSLLLEVDGASREVPVKRLPEVTRSWGEDIAPIYTANCTGSTCHGSDTENVPDLSTLEAWQSYAAEIRIRVIEAKTMPPPAARTEEWDDDEQPQIIAEWLEGGMLP